MIYSLVPLLKSGKTVFSNDDLRLYWQINDDNYLKTKIYRLVKKGALIRLVNGIYALDRSYNPLELANKLVVPSYVSLRTVLAQVGAVFQYDSAVYSVSTSNRDLEIDGRHYVYFHLKGSALLANEGVRFAESVTIASPERALLDLLYLEKEATVDSITPFDWNVCQTLVPLYQNKQLTKRLNNLFKSYAG